MRTIYMVLALLAWLPSRAQQVVDSRTREIVVKNVTVVPMDAEKVLRRQTVVIKDGIITAMGRRPAYGKDALVVSGRGKYLLPGLADMHGHINSNGDEQKGKEILLLYAVNGVTTLKNMMGGPEHLLLRDKVAAGEWLGPRILSAGPQLSGWEVKSVEDGVARVKSQKLAGYDLLKIKEGLTLPVLEAIAKTAKEEGIPFGGHVPFGVGIFNAAKLGYATIDHLDGIIPALLPRLDTMSERDMGIFGFKKAYLADLSKLDSVLAALRLHHVWVTPTQSFAEHWQSPLRTREMLLQYPEMKYVDKATLDRWSEMKTQMVGAPSDAEHTIQYLALRKKIVLACQQQGVGLLAGTDAGQVFMVPGFVLHREMGYLVEAGLTPYQALRTATYQVGQFLGNGQIGVVRQGAVADLLLLGGNPLKDIRAIDRVEGVLLNGRWLSKQEIGRILKGLEKS